MSDRKIPEEPVDDRIIKLDRSLIPACDMSEEKFKELLMHTGDINGIGAYKVGFQLVLNLGLDILNNNGSLDGNFIYNHKGGATDVPFSGQNFMNALYNPSINGVVLSPLTGPKTQSEWVDFAHKAGKKVIIEPLVNTDTFAESEGGYLKDTASEEMIVLSIKHGVKDFIVPRTVAGKQLYETIENLGGQAAFREKNQEVDFGSLGFVKHNELTAYDVLPTGLGKIAEIVAQYTDKPIIYDHQKAGTDVVGNAEKFANACKDNVDAVIFFPTAGPEVQEAYTWAAQDAGLGVIMGGHMTHDKYIASKEGFVLDDAPSKMYGMAALSGVNDFVMPGTIPELTKMYREELEANGHKVVVYSPGLVSQGGSVVDATKAAGKYFHAIVGRAISKEKDMRFAAHNLVEILNNAA